jgi:hypothetical protein
MENDINKLDLKKLMTWMVELDTQVKLMKFQAERARVEIIGIHIYLSVAIIIIAFWVG